jgi:hypothetical protein
LAAEPKDWIPKQARLFPAEANLIRALERIPSFLGRRARAAARVNPFEIKNRENYGNIAS